MGKTSGSDSEAASDIEETVHETPVDHTFQATPEPVAAAAATPIDLKDMPEHF